MLPWEAEKGVVLETVACPYLNRDETPGLGVCHQRVRSKQVITMGEAPQERDQRVTGRVAAWHLPWGRTCLP